MEEIKISNSCKSNEWFLEKVKKYHGNKVEILSEYNGSEKPIDIVYHRNLHGDTYTTINAKNICKTYFLPCKKCQSENKSSSAKKTHKKDKKFYYDRLVKYCSDRGGKVLETKWTKAKDTYHFKCGNPDHPVFSTTADALYSGDHWCPYCSGRSGNFQKKIEQICKEKDGELLDKYTNSATYVSVKCNKHNFVWNILPNNILKGRWCPVCNMGFNEKVVWDYFTNMSCNIKPQYKFSDLVGESNEELKFDFAIFNKNGNLIYLVEVDDEEHRYNHSSNTPRQKQRIAAQERDIKKNEYCKTNNIPLYRMEVPFIRGKRWSYEDYYRYINTELKFIVNLSRDEKEETC